MSQNPTYNTPIYKTQNKSLNLSLRYKYRSNNRKNALHTTQRDNLSKTEQRRLPKKERKKKPPHCSLQCSYKRKSASSFIF